MAEYWELEDWVEQIALRPIRYFYPTLPSKDLGQGLSEIIEGLLQLVERGWLELLWEIRCPACFNSTVPSEDCPKYGEEIECQTCQEPFEINEYTLFPVFRVTPQYQARVSKKNKKSFPQPFQKARRRMVGVL